MHHCVHHISKSFLYPLIFIYNLVLVMEAFHTFPCIVLSLFPVIIVKAKGKFDNLI